MDKKAFMQLELAQPKQLNGGPPPVVPFADWDYYYITIDLDWKDESGQLAPVSVPKGFVTDLASIPQLFYSILPPTGRYSYPAIVHDFLYWCQPCERAAADNTLKAAMVEMNVPVAKVAAIYNAVRLAGGSPWNSNAAARTNGEHRVLKRYPTDFKTTWASWKLEPDVFAADPCVPSEPAEANRDCGGQLRPEPSAER